MNITRIATIAAGASLSDAIQVENGIIVGIQMPSVWTAAALTLVASSDDATYGPVKNDAGTEKSITVVASDFIMIPPSTFLGGCDSVKLRSGTAGTPVNQAAERSIIVTIMPL